MVANEKIVYLDWDFDHNTFKTTVVWNECWLKNVQEVAKRCGTIEWWHRSSSSGKTHIKMVFTRELELIEQLCIRAILGDDYARIVCDLKRTFRHGELETDRVFDWKIKLLEANDEEVVISKGTAGPWIYGGCVI